MFELIDKIISTLGRNTLYYPGCLMKFAAPEMSEAYRKLLARCHEDFIVLSEQELCCGSPVESLGYRADFEKLIRKNAGIFAKHGVGRIVTPCPACYRVFLKEYPTVLGDWRIKVEHFSQTLLHAIKDGRLRIKNKQEGTAVFHDPCHLGRYCGVYEEPREIIKMMGFELIELPRSRERALCCGGGGSFRVNFRGMADRIAKEFASVAKKNGADRIITMCPLCYLHLKQNSEIPVEEMGMILLKAVGD
ncbi:MAG: (Fe-S)-binding protein [Candidatus Micrarchaeia archaeon]